MRTLIGRIVPAVVILSAAFLLFSYVTGVSADAESGVRASSRETADLTWLSVSGLGEFHKTQAQVSELRTLNLPNSNAVVSMWNETDSDGTKPFYSISPDGNTPGRAIRAEYDLKLRFFEFDPLETTPFAPSDFLGRQGNDGKKGTYIIQFFTHVRDEYRQAIRSIGGKDFSYLPNNAVIAHLSGDAAEVLRGRPFVRWVGNYEPWYKLDETLIDGIATDALKPKRYNIMALDRGPEMQEAIASRIRSLGGSIHLKIPEGFRIEATLDASQVFDVAFHNDVMFIDEWSEPENDMDVVRTIGGANTIETTLGFRGQGVRAEVMDNGLRQTHGDFNSGLAPLIHNSPDTNEPSNHGTSTFGINFARGTADVAGLGMLPDAQGIFADYNHLTNRYTHTARLVAEPYNAVYQSNSWGSSLTQNYTTISAEMDDILFLNDIVVLNSQSNAGTRSSRPQAWAKNVVSIGGIRHFNTATFDDDRWNSGASIGPAADGRIKPELAHFYDSVFTTSRTSDTSYTTSFGGTSAATPITAGHFGIFYQMWHAGAFGNPTGASVFESRPHMTTAKAVMINTAVQWDMTIPGTDVGRNQQGFGRASLDNLYALRTKMLVLDETDVLLDQQSKTYFVTVPAASPDPLKVTMVYADPMGVPAATMSRINDLHLKVTAPDGTTYWGNNGLRHGEGMWSTAGGEANRVDTVENVFIQAPAAGVWTIEVIAAELNQDGRPESAGVVDADFALVASGILQLSPTPAPVSVGGRVLTAGGLSVSGAQLRLTDDSGNVRIAMTGPFGYYNFDGVSVGQNYTVSISAKRFNFIPSSVIRMVNENISDVDFIAADPGVRGLK